MPKPDDTKTGPQEISEPEINLIADELTGNVASFLIDRLRTQESAYRYMSEDMQKEVIADAGRAAEHLVQSVVRLIASAGRETIPVKIKKVENDGDKIKVTIEASKMDAHRHALFDAAGAFAHITVADHEKYQGGEAPQPDSDQRTLDMGDGEKEAA